MADGECQSTVPVTKETETNSGEEMFDTPETLYAIVSDTNHPNNQQAIKAMKAMLSSHTNYCMMLETYMRSQTESGFRTFQPLSEHASARLTPGPAKFSYKGAAAARRKLWGLPPRVDPPKADKQPSHNNNKK